MEHRDSVRPFLKTISRALLRIFATLAAIDLLSGLTAVVLVLILVSHLHTGVKVGSIAVVLITYFVSLRQI